MRIYTYQEVGYFKATELSTPINTLNTGNSSNSVYFEAVNPHPDNPIITMPLNGALSGEHRRLDWHQIFFITEGEGTCEIDYVSEPLGRHQVISVPRGAILKEDFQSCKGYTLLFLEEFFTEVQRELLEAYWLYAVLNRKLLINLSEHLFELLKQYVTLIELETGIKDDPNRLFILQNLMLALFNRLEGLVLSEDSPFITHRSVFQQFVRLLNAHFIEQKAVSFYTDHLNITAKQLNKILRETMGRSTQELISEKTLLEARRRLCFTAASIKTISYELGFDSPYYFSRFFKSKTDQSPEEFRMSFAI